MKANLTSLCLLFSLAAGVTVAQDEAPKPRGEKITLKLNLAAGDVRTLATKMNMDMTATKGGEKREVAWQFGSQAELKCNEVSAQGVHAVDVTYKQMSMRSILDGVTVAEFDSERKDNVSTELTLPFEALLNGSFTLKLSAAGKVVAVEGVDELADKAAEKATGLNTAQLKRQVQGLVSRFDQMLAAYPSGPVDIRDTWKKESNIGDAALSAKATTHYTLYDRKDGVAIIRLEGDIAGPGAPAPGGTTGTLKGTIQLNEKTGWITTGDIQITFTRAMNNEKVNVTTHLTLDGK